MDIGGSGKNQTTKIRISIVVLKLKQVKMFPLFKSEVKTYHTLFHKERKKAFEGLAFLTSIVSVRR